ncbi:MAG: hypothetical protein ACTSVO_03690 [Candidatus Heimdallarchaeaceae archaeon]
MNEESIEQVGKLADVNINDLTKNGLKKKITLVYYYLIQFAFLIFLSLVGMIFGLYSRSVAAYPYSGFPQRYIYGPIILALTHGGNLGLSYQLSRKKRLILKKSEPKELSPVYIYPAIFLNILLSVISLFSVHNFVLDGSIFLISTMYGVYEKDNLNIKNIFCWSKQR